VTITPNQLDLKSGLAESIEGMVKVTQEDIDLFKSVAQKTFTPKFFKKEALSEDLVLENNWEIIAGELVAKYEEELKPKNENDEEAKSKKQKNAKGIRRPGSSNSLDLMETPEMYEQRLEMEKEKKEAIEENKDEEKKDVEKKDDSAKSEDESDSDNGEISTKTCFDQINAMLLKNENKTKLEHFRKITQLFAYANKLLAKNAVLMTVAATDPRAEKSPFIRDFLNMYRSYC